MSEYGRWGGAYLTVDTSQLQSTIGEMRSILSKKNFQKLMYRSFKEVASRSKTLIAREVTKDYAVTQKWVKSGIGHYKLNIGSNVQCVIPLTGVKGTIGGRFRASGQAGSIWTQILREKVSELPSVMVNQGGNPPFINYASSTLGGVAFTRRKATRLPIVRVVGLGVPQMPLNQSADGVSSELLEYAWKRLEHNFNYMFRR